MSVHQVIVHYYDAGLLGEPNEYSWVAFKTTKGHRFSKGGRYNSSDAKYICISRRRYRRLVRAAKNEARSILKKQGGHCIRKWHQNGSFSDRFLHDSFHVIKGHMEHAVIGISAQHDAASSAMFRLAS